MGIEEFYSVMDEALSQLEKAERPTKTTANIPADLYGQMWGLIAQARGRGEKLTVQQVLVSALRNYLAEKAKDEAA